MAPTSRGQRFSDLDTMELSLDGNNVIVTRSREIVGHIRYLPAKGRLPKRWQAVWPDGRTTSELYSKQEALMHFYLHLATETIY